MVEKYGKKLYKNHMLGYKDSQLLLGLEHNTPNLIYKQIFVNIVYLSKVIQQVCATFSRVSHA
jgi:hypothetical protein